MIGKRVIDSEGVELGVVSKIEDDFVEVSEGLFDELLLRKDYIGREEEEEVILRDTVFNLLSGLKVEDCQGAELGVVKETVSAGDVLDTLIIETEDDKLFFIVLEEIYKIADIITLDIDAKEVRARE
jgi:sporulation protein YlmC with PRC-barrel domain